MENYQDIIKSLKKQWELNSDISDLECKMRDWRIARWRAEGGFAVEAMFESPANALKEVSDSTPRQKVAIEILAYYWKISSTPKVLATLLHVIKTNRNDSVREIAILAVTTGLGGSRHVFWLRFLAEIVQNESESIVVQSVAYLALFRIVGIAWPFDGDRIQQFKDHFPSNIDWEFVNDCKTGHLVNY